LAPSFVWSKNINKANFENELMLTEIAMLIATSEKQQRYAPKLKQNHWFGSFFCSVIVAPFFSCDGNATQRCSSFNANIFEWWLSWCCYWQF
jgi:hypothetical protein